MKAIKLRLKLMLYAKIVTYADKNGLNIAESIRQILTEYFKKNETEHILNEFVKRNEQK